MRGIAPGCTNSSPLERKSSPFPSSIHYPSPTSLKAPLFFVLSLTLLAGCGAGTPSSPAPPAAIPALSEDWSLLGIATSPANLPTPVPLLTGTLTSSGATVTGTLRAYAGFPPGPDPSVPCVAPLTPLLVSGTVDAAGNLNLTIPIANGIATITGLLAADHHTSATGSLTITGGACAMAATPMHITNFANATGTYTGTLDEYTVNSTGITVIVPNTATPITVTLTEATTPNALGAFPVTGSVITTGACPAQFTITPGTTISGGVFFNTSLPDPSANPPFNDLAGAFKPDASSLFVGSFLDSGVCAQFQLQGNLTPQ